MTRLCVPITGRDHETMMTDARAAVSAGADVIELRLDYLDPLDPVHVEALVTRICTLGRPIIVTCRIEEEGGRFGGSEELRIEIFEAALRAGADCIDVELQSWSRSGPLRDRLWAALDQAMARPGQLFVEGAGQILSMHDFQATPDRFEPILGHMLSTPVDILKVACKANSVIDSLRVLEALYQWRNVLPTIALAMGETGTITRVLAKKLGAFLTFASLEQGKESAPGQPTIAQMKSIYRWDKLSEKTKVYGVIGCPVAHSMSPAIHNAAFDATGHDGIYLPMRVEPAYEDFKAFMDAVLARPWLDLEGLSVTIPHKENLLRYAREYAAANGQDLVHIEPLAARIGVANTLVIAPASEINRARSASEGFGSKGSEAPPSDRAQDASRTSQAASQDPGNPQSAIRNPQFLSVFNTDYAGALDALTQGMEVTRSDLKDMRIAVLGAGGAARAIVAGLRDCGAIVFIYNRSGNKSRALAAEFGCISMPWESREMIDTEVIINCTSIGMWPNIDESPLNIDHIPPNTVLFDTIANPLESRLLREAKLRDCQIIPGVNMFINQAALQFKHWTGIEAPRDLMRKVVIEGTSKG